MDWNYMKKLLRLFLGAFSLLIGLVLTIYNITLGVEPALAFFALLLVLLGGLGVFFGYHALPKAE